MIEIQVESERSYNVSIDTNWSLELEKIAAEHAKILIIAPESMKARLNLDGYEVFYTPDGEEQKTLGTVGEIWNILGEIQLGRKDAIVGIGGGATTDVAGFVAATWLRGVTWYAIPTTLAAMVDASVGGKTGINTGAGKNLVGAFYSPAAVLIDLSFLETLSDRDYAAGLAEVIKTGIISDVSILDLLESTKDISAARSHSAELISKSIQVKAKVVSADFTEGKLREILNFGHTLGHAIEKLSAFELRHGEAVSIGTIYALYLSEELGGLDPAITARVATLLVKFSLPTSLKNGEWSSILALMQGDKKARDSKLRFIGISELGNPVWLESVPTEIAAKSYERIRS
jgi:3-dehydroquinate synthase